MKWTEMHPTDVRLLTDSELREYVIALAREMPVTMYRRQTEEGKSVFMAVANKAETL